MIVTTSTHLEGYRVIQHLGLVRGIIVRSRSLLGNIAGGLQTLLGGNITIYTELCERTRDDAYKSMVAHAEQLSANAIINMRYDANEIMQGVT
ncbi:MAG: YbjQ family protein, partial [Segetibacter sp.]